MRAINFLLSILMSLAVAALVLEVGLRILGLGPTPVRARAAEAAAVGAAAAEVDVDEIGRLVIEGLEDVPADVHAPADYRRRIGAVVTARALRRATEEANGG